jgi:hypothetical protein
VVARLHATQGDPCTGKSFVDGQDEAAKCEAAKCEDAPEEHRFHCNDHKGMGDLGKQLYVCKPGTKDDGCTADTSQPCAGSSSNPQCPNGVYMPSTETCCAGGALATDAAGTCTHWQIFPCDTLNGHGCCCDQGAMADAFCQDACSAAAGCVNREEEPYKGTGCYDAGDDDGDGGGVSDGGAALLGAFAGGLVLLGAGWRQRQLGKAGAKTGARVPLLAQPLLAQPMQAPPAPGHGGAQRPLVGAA